MINPLGFLITLVIVILFLWTWNKVRTRGRMLCYFLRDDKSVNGELCRLQDDFVIHGNYAYDVYPDFVRVVKFPMGWPWLFQEMVPSSLYDEKDAIPLDWVNLGNRLESAMNLRSALDENWVRKLVHEAAVEGGGGGLKLNFRKIFPIILMVIGVVGLIFLIKMGGLRF